jgi:lysophospholipase L1-like esterase
MTLKITEEMENSLILRLLQEAAAVCFIGDSLTEGTINGGIPWYNPIRQWISGRIVNVSQGGMTTTALLAVYLREILNSEAELYVIAVGANDILFRDAEFCAVTAEEYIQNLQSIRTAVVNRMPEAKFVFIAPWIAMDGDMSIIGGMKPPDTDLTYKSYTSALKEWCSTTGDTFINANEYLADHFSKHPQSDYLIDFIHPNSGPGVKLYAEAVLKECK